MSGKTETERFWEKVRKTDGCWWWTGSKSHGYGRMKWRGATNAAHRISWEFAFGPRPAHLLVLHRCDNPSCVRPDHLFLGTQKDNVDDMGAKGRHVFPRVGHGEQAAAHKLSNAKVAEIRSLEGLESASQLAARFGCSVPHVHRIWRLKTRRTG